MDDPVLVTKVCMLAGKIMLESGAETSRVEDTMNRIATAFGLVNAQSYATPTGINFSTGFAEITNFIRISNRSTDLHKIADVNAVSRKITAGRIDAAKALSLLNEIDCRNLEFPGWIQVIAAALVSGSFTIMFGGIWGDFLPSLLIGGLGFAAMLCVEKLVEIRFIAEFAASFVIGILTFTAIQSGFGVEVDKIIIGAVMPLVPGLHITNAVRDLMSGHLVAGLSKGVEAVLTAFAIGAGIAVVFGIFSYWVG